MTMIIRARRRLAVCAACALLCVYALPAQAQEQNAAAALIGFGGTNALTELQARIQEATMQGSSLALEGALDPNEYTVGPGDRFNVGIGGLLSNTYSLIVSAGGFLDLPEAGQIHAAGRQLAEVQQEALAALQDKHANVPVSVSLVQARSFYVHVSGAVPQPGRYLMLPISRVDELLSEAFTPRYFDIDTGNYIYLPARRPDVSRDYQPSFRNVSIDHRDGSRTLIDLVRYYIHGEIEHNPYLRDGDRVVVPTFHEGRDGVRVSGDIAYAGTYDLRLGDTVKDLLWLAAGPDGTAHLDSVIVARAETKKSLWLSAQRILRGEDENPVLMPGDHIVARTVPVAIARIQGRVKFPGSYAIEDGRTTLRELILMAGGLEPDAHIDAAFVHRTNSMDFREKPTQSSLGFFSRHFAESYAVKPEYRVQVDLRAVVASGNESMVLYDGDRVVFPRDEQVVQVTGQVHTPAYVTVEEGQSARHYINLVGGLAPGSTKVYVLKGSSGEVLIGAHHIVESGDTIFVDRIPIADTPEMQQLLLTEQRNRLQRTQVLLAGLTAITGIVTTYVAVFGRK